MRGRVRAAGGRDHNDEQERDTHHDEHEYE